MTLTKIISETLPKLPDTYGVPAQTTTIRNDLIAVGGEFKAVTTTAEANSIGESLRNIRSHIATVRELGLAYRQPITKAAKLIKSTEDTYLAPLEAEQLREEGIYKVWLKAEERRKQDEELARQKEIRRLADEAARLESEAAAKRAAADAGEGAKQTATKAENKAEDAANAVTMAIMAPPPETHKVAGVVPKKIVVHKVTDQSLLLKNRPDLFKIEIKPSALKAVCFPNNLDATEDKPDTTSIPGMTMFYELDVNTCKW